MGQGENTALGDVGVPADIDAHRAEGEEMFDLYSEVHQNGCPVVHSSAHGGFYMVASHPELRRAADDWRTLSSAGGIALPKLPLKAIAIEEDPPDHDASRAVYKEVLSADTLRTVESSVRGDAAELIDSFAARGHAELVSELTEVVPGNTICRIIGVTETDRIQVGCRLGIALGHSAGSPDAPRILGEFQRFCTEELDARRERPRADHLTDLALNGFAGRAMTDEELAGVLLGFFFAGHHTTTAAMSSLFQKIATDAEIRDTLVADPSLIPRAVEETVRTCPPGHGFFRQATRDTEIQGTPIPAGSEVWLNYAAGNRDPTVFDDPDAFRLDRQPNPHLSFGYGIHTCVGAALARMELRVVTEELLSRLPDVKVAEGEQVKETWRGATGLLVERLPVAFTPPG